MHLGITSRKVAEVSQSLTVTYPKDRFDPGVVAMRQREARRELAGSPVRQFDQTTSKCFASLATSVTFGRAEQSPLIILTWLADA